jgi:flagellin
MALTILNNIAALAAENQLNITSGNLNSTLAQLSSGSRINSGADDPAGLAIADGLQANVAALTQSASNATDGVGTLQVADGALSQVTTLLDRAVTLATEASNSGLSTAQSAALDGEFTAIKTEIDSIGNNTNYNGSQVFSSTPISVFLSDGTTSGSNTISAAPGTLSSNSLLGSAAAGTLAFTAAPASGDTIEFSDGTNTQTYTFEAGAAFTGAAGQVLIDPSTNPVTSLQNTEANLVAAVNGGTGAGTTYGALTPINKDVTASVSGTSIVFTATAAGNAVIAAGGAITPTVTSTAAAFIGTPFAAGSATSLTTANNAQSALTAITGAIATIAATRGTLGATVEQLQAASNVITVQTQNLTSAENNITAADIPSTVANLSQYSILEQTGISALSQANQQQQLVLKLLQ